MRLPRRTSFLPNFYRFGCWPLTRLKPTWFANLTRFSESLLKQAENRCFAPAQKTLETDPEEDITRAQDV
jgi:hypothetical protein